MAGLTLTHVTKRYGHTTALRDVSFDIAPGEFVVLLGPSGAGKSTLLRILNGLTPPTSGQALIGNQSVSRARTDVAMVFQTHSLIEAFSAYHNALTGALGRTGTMRSLLGAYRRADKEAALAALEVVDLLPHATKRVTLMSGGEQQRVGIARALVQEPALLLADEPVASLDPKSARDVMQYMKRAAQERGLTTIASLHQVEIARAFGDRFLGMLQGELVLDGGPDALTMDVIDRIYHGQGQDATSPAGPA
jgi:phosphonate transport system ATP-binding protein